MRIFQKILPALLPFLLLSCRYKDPELLEYKVFDSLIFERKMTFDDMISDVMDQYGEHSSAYGELAELLEEGRQAAEDYTVYGITYNSLDHEGKPVKATGLVYYPETTYLKGVIEIVPVNKSKFSCGSVNRSVPEAIAGCTGYIMIVPDLLGCGGTEDYPISYLQHDDIVRLAVDMRKAAYEFLYNHRYIRLGNKDYIFGYSLGGGGALALARHYSLHPECGIKVKELWLGAGAWDPLAAVKEYAASGRCGAVILPNMLVSIDFYNHLGVDFSTVFKGEFLENYQELTAGYISTDSLTTRFGPELDAYIDMDFFAEDNAVWQKVQDALSSQLVPVDFKPSFPVFLYHSADDATIPVSASDSLNARLLRAGAKVYYHRTEGSHHLTGFKIEGDMARHLL